MAEYLGKVTGLVTGAELVGLTGVSRYTLITSGDIEWLKFKYKGNMLFIASKGVSYATPWYWLNQAGCVYGKDIVINNNTYNCRLMKGGKSDPASEIGGEWKDLIIDLVPDNAISNWSGYYTLCQEKYSAYDNHVICTGNNSVSMFYYFENTASRSDLVWRPVLELKCKLTNSISTQDLGDILNFENLTYTISGDTHTVIEELDGDIIKNLSNQSDGTTYTLDLSSKWDSLDYGKHTILITATDSNGADNTVSITFNKIKPPITKPSENASLVDLVDFTEEINKEIEYQSFKLKNNLIEKGVECSDTDKMSSLIDKIASIEPGKKWASGSITTTIANSTTSTTTICSALPFKPSLAFVMLKTQHGVYSPCSNVVFTNLAPTSISSSSNGQCIINSNNSLSLQRWDSNGISGRILIDWYAFE